MQTKNKRRTETMKTIITLSIIIMLLFPTLTQASQTSNEKNIKANTELIIVLSKRISELQRMLETKFERAYECHGDMQHQIDLLRIKTNLEPELEDLREKMYLDGFSEMTIEAYKAGLNGKEPKQPNIPYYMTAYEVGKKEKKDTSLLDK